MPDTYNNVPGQNNPGKTPQHKVTNPKIKNRFFFFFLKNFYCVKHLIYIQLPFT